MVHLIGAKKSAPILRMSQNFDSLKFQKFFRDPKFSWDFKKFSWKSRIFGTSKNFWNFHENPGFFNLSKLAKSRLKNLDFFISFGEIGQIAQNVSKFAQNLGQIFPILGKSFAQISNLPKFAQFAQNSIQKLIDFDDFSHKHHFSPLKCQKRMGFWKFSL